MGLLWYVLSIRQISEIKCIEICTIGSNVLLGPASELLNPDVERFVAWEVWQYSCTVNNAMTLHQQYSGFKSWLRLFCVAFAFSYFSALNPSTNLIAFSVSLLFQYNLLVCVRNRDKRTMHRLRMKFQRQMFNVTGRGRSKRQQKSKPKSSPNGAEVQNNKPEWENQIKPGRSQKTWNKKTDRYR